MTARAEGFPREIQERPRLKALNIRSGVAGTIYRGSAICRRIGSQMAEMPDANGAYIRADLIFEGWATNDVTITAAVDSGGGGWAVDADNNPLTVNVESGIGCGLDTGTGADAITMDDLGAIVFGYDTNTVYRTSNNGQLSPIGTVARVGTTGLVDVDIAPEPWVWAVGGASGAPSDTPPTAFSVRAVITALGAYTAAAGVITVTAAGALGAQDGITLAAGDEVWLPEYAGTANSSVNVSAANSGPYEVVDPGGATQAVLRRPRWWQHGATMPLGAKVTIAEGTLFARTTWDIGAAKGATIGTSDPSAYPREVVQQVTLVSSAAVITNVPIRSAAKTTAAGVLVTSGGTTTGTVGYASIAAATPGPIGTASITVAAVASGGTKNGTADTSTINAAIRQN